MAKDAKGRWIKGTHWRDRKPWWDREWLVREYIDKRRSASEIAREGGCGENNILFWLDKHQIPRRSVSEVRAFKRWGAVGPKNPMFGKRGPLSPNFKNGNTPYRQRTYSRAEWKEFMRQVWARDRCCRLCGSKEKCEIHHIDPVRNTPLLIMDIGNVILLCESCHDRLKGRELWWRKRLFKLIGQ